MIGTRLGQYEIIEELGRGGMATVYRAYQPSAGRYVAIKIIHRALATDQQGMDRFEREAQLVSRLEHPYLLPVFDVNITNDPPYIVMRYLEGGTLKEVIEQRTVVPLGEILYLMRQISGALDYAHRQGVVHRDIKPSNIMVDEDGNAFLTDFGIARIDEGVGLTQTGFTVGTPGYMSPEQGMADDTITAAADVYSLAVMLFEMATGQSPYGGSTPMAILMKHIQEPIPSATQINSDLPPEIDAIIAKGMAKEPENRYQSAGDLVEDLAKIVDTSQMRSAPQTLMTAATMAVQNIREKRDDRQDEINTLMEQFAAKRTKPAAEVLPDIATQLTPSAEVKGITSSQQSTSSSDGSGRNMILIAGGVVGAIILVVGALLVFSPSGPSPVELTETQSAIVALAETQTAENLPTNTEVPTDTVTPAVSDTPSNTPRPSDTPDVPLVAARRNIDIRVGPGPNFGIVSTLEANDQLEIIGRTEDNRWVQVLRLDGTDGWILRSAALISIFGELDSAPVVEGPTLTPSNTPTHTPTSTNTPTPTNTPTSTSTFTSTPDLTQTANAEATDAQATADIVELTSVFIAQVAIEETDTAATQVIIEETNIAETQTVATSQALQTQDAIESDNMTATALSAQQTNVYETQVALEQEQALATQNAEATDIAAIAQQTDIAIANETATSVALESVNVTATQNAIKTETQAVIQQTIDAGLTETAIFGENIAATFIAEQTRNAPTATFTPTLTPTPTSTNTPTATPTIRPTDLATPSPTPRPLGLMPFVGDFEGDNPLMGWDYPSDAWTTVTEGGQTILLGQAQPSQAIHIMGLEIPEWLEAPDFVVSFRANIGNSAGTRMMFRSTEGLGYNAIDIREGVIFLTRNNLNAPNRPTDFATANNEIRLSTVSLPIRLNEWNEYTVWVEGQRIFVYFNKELVILAEDLNLPQLGAGDIFLQNLTGAQAMRFDDIVIQRAEPSSDHFQSAQIPSDTWQFTDSTPIQLESENSGNQYVAIRGETEFAPIMAPMRDFELRCRLWSEQGGYKIVLRENAGSRWEMTGVGGNLSIDFVTSAGDSAFSTEVRNFFTRGLWQDLHVIFIGDRFELYLDGELEYEDTLETSPPAGTIKFVTGRSDFLRIDDCLLTQSAATTDTGAQFAYELRDEVEARDFRDLLSDLIDRFDDPFLGPQWWGNNAPGQYQNDPTATDHQSFLRMTHLGAPTFRIFNSNLGISLFPDDRDAGQANVNNKSTDVLVSVDTRFLEGTTGEAWMTTRATQSGGGQGVFGYRFGISRDINGAYTLNISLEDQRNRQDYYNGPIPGADDTTLPEWINLTVITRDDKIAFFANDRFVVFVDNANKLTGSIALGVEAGTTVDFDTFVVRDTSPLGE